MSICATIGVPRIVEIPACIHDGFVVFRNYENKLDRWFLYHYLDFIASRLSYGGQAGTQSNLNTGLVGKTRLPLPSIDEQNCIVAVLDAADQHIAQMEKKLTALRELKRGLMETMLTQNITGETKPQARSSARILRAKLTLEA